MTGQTFNHQDGVTLREYLERIIEHNEKTSEKALVIARDELARRLEALNGETGRIKDILATTLPRELAEQRFGNLEKDIRELLKFKNEMDGKASQKSVTLAYFFSGASLLLAIIGLVINLTK